jgi:Domain of unknown function (DUF4440)
VPRTKLGDLQKSVEAFDRCWVEGRPDDLRQFLHAKVVFAGPQFERLASGVDACVKSYESFLAQAKVHGFSPSEYLIDVAGDSAVVTYRWTIDYEYQGDRLKESGQDLLVWVHRAGRWLVTWRSQRPEAT